MKKALLLGLSLVVGIGMFSPLFAAERVVVCEELYQEG